VGLDSIAPSVLNSSKLCWTTFVDKVCLPIILAHTLVLSGIMPANCCRIHVLSFWLDADR